MYFSWLFTELLEVEGIFFFCILWLSHISTSPHHMLSFLCLSTMPATGLDNKWESIQNQGYFPPGFLCLFSRTAAVAVSFLPKFISLTRIFIEVIVSVIATYTLLSSQPEPAFHLALWHCIYFAKLSHSTLFLIIIICYTFGGLISFPSFL